MLNESRIDIYDYLYNIFVDVVTKNVYAMREPQELTKSDTTDGFLVIHVGEMNDESEFQGQAFGWARCYVEAYVPPTTRGRLDYTKYKAFEDGINAIIDAAAYDNHGTYRILEGSVISLDADETTNANNAYYVFIKSFIVTIN